ncbi:hypothetical protein OIO90_002400 [Microbotryomycetes sp. JL221]|nr:hypothetical protein OIO90_002400 [Microbotryomycetes sp. JL221]
MSHWTLMDVVEQQQKFVDVVITCFVNSRKADDRNATGHASQLVMKLKQSPYTTSDWAAVPLHPSPSRMPPLELLHWIFVVSTLNFSFWSDELNHKRFGVTYKTGVDGKETLNDKIDPGTGQRQAQLQTLTGYFSLLAALHRARDENVDVTNPRWYANATDEEIRHVFRSDQQEQMPLLDERIRVLRETGRTLCDRYNGSFAPLVEAANHSALKLIDLIVSTFACYDDKSLYPATGQEPIYIRKRAQILIAETWAAFEGKGFGQFDDIDQVTMFADYRVPQILHSLGTIKYSSALEKVLTNHEMLPQGCPMEVEIRCLSIVAVEEIRRAIAEQLNEPSTIDNQQKSENLSNETLNAPNAVLLDFLLWDLAKVEEAQGRAQLPHHRTRSVFY